MALEQRAATRQRGHEREPGNAAPAALAETAFVEADDQRRSMVPPLKPRRHDADDAGMPALRAHNDRRVSRGIEPFRELRLRLAQYVILHGAALAVLRVEPGGQRAGAGLV